MAPERNGTGEDPGAFVELADPAMVVVTAAVGDERSGCLAGFHTQCSIDPPRYAVMLSKSNHTYQTARRADLLGVNLLDADQTDIAELFGSQTADDGVDKFDHCRVASWEQRVPLIEGAAAWIVGEIVERLDVGDHVLHGLAPLRVETSETGCGPLRFAAISSLDPGHPA